MARNQTFKGLKILQPKALSIPTTLSSIMYISQIGSPAQLFSFSLETFLS